MIQPNELKKKSFSKAVRGYAQSEVDEYIDFLIDTYTQLYRENAELERKLHLVSAKYDEIASDEESIRSAVLKAQKLSEAMVSNAKKKADDIVFTVEDRCREVLEQNNRKLEEEKKKLSDVRTMALDFKEKLYSQYLEHVKLIKEMALPSPDAVEEDLVTFGQMKEIAMQGLSPKEDVLNASKDAEKENVDPLEKSKTAFSGEEA